MEDSFRTATPAARGDGGQTNLRRQNSRVSSLTPLLASAHISVSVLDPLESFEALLEEDQLRVYHLYRAVCGTQKLAFLQSSPESPGILLLFQKLFNSPLETNWSPGDVLLDMQKSCHSKNLSDAVVKFITYVALFYYNFGNYDLITGAKIVPELTRHEFKEVVQCTRAFTQNHGSGVQSLLDDVLDAIYSQNNSATQPHGKAPDPLDHDSNLRTGTAQEFRRSYPFYGDGVTMDDAIGVDRVLMEHQISLLNTRIALRRQDTSMNTHAKVFLVRQAALDSRPGGGIVDMKSAFVEKLRMTAPPVHVFHMRNRNQIHFSKGDHHAILSEIQTELLAATTPVAPEEGSSTHSKISNQQDQLVHHLIMFFEHGDVASQDAAVQLWRHGDDCAAFFIGIFPLPPARDPLHRRGAVESFLAIRNAFFHSRTQKLLRPKLLSELVCALPFHELMQLENRMTSVSVECLDVIVTGRCVSLLTSLQPRMRCDMFDEDEDASKSNSMKPPRTKVLFLANCMTHFAHGLATPEKTVLLSGFISDTNQAIVGDERERVRYLQFLCEDVLSLCTSVFLHETSVPGVFNLDRSKVIRLPPQCGLFDDENGAKEPESGRLQKPFAQHSSFGQRAAQWYRAGERYHTKFSPTTATVLEECRKVLLGLTLSLQRHVQKLVVGNWKGSSASSAPSFDHSRFAKAYWAVILRDALFGIVFYSREHFRWEDNKMQARFIVLQMLLYGDQLGATDEALPPTDDDKIVELLATFDSSNRTHSGMATTTPSSKSVVSLRLHFLCHDEALWVQRAKLRVYTWLQRIQWIQITGDVAAGNDLYRRYSRVDDSFLQYQALIIAQLSSSSSLSNTKNGTNDSSVPQKLRQVPQNRDLPQSSERGPDRVAQARQRAAGLHNRSSFAHDTLWVPPVLQKCARRGPQRGATVMNDEELLTLSKHNGKGHDVSESPPPSSSSEPIDDCITMRVFKADLAHAIEAKVLTIGVIEDNQRPSFTDDMGT